MYIIYIYIYTHTHLSIYIYIYIHIIECCGTLTAKRPAFRAPPQMSRGRLLGC